MALNVKMAIYRGTLAHLQALASTGQQGVLAWTTDSNELYVDNGSGTVGIGALGAGFAWTKVAASTTLFTASSSAAMVALEAQVGDLVDRTDVHQIFILTAFPASTAGNWTAISPDSSVTGIVGMSSPTANEWVQYIDTSGTQHLAQIAFSNLSGNLTEGQLPATISSGSSLTLIDLGTF